MYPTYVSYIYEHIYISYIYMFIKPRLLSSGEIHCSASTQDSASICKFLFNSGIVSLSSILQPCPLLEAGSSKPWEFFPTHGLSKNQCLGQHIVNVQ